MSALTVRNAEVKTAAVEVKTLTISGKQVTLAVFRQLREEPLIAADGTLNGVPWGTVNYHPGKCGNDPKHLHVVWQLGAELRRARIDYPSFYSERFYPDTSDLLIQAIYCSNGHQLPGDIKLIKDREFGDWVHAFTFDGVRCWDAGVTPKHPCDEQGHQCVTAEEYQETLGQVRNEVAGEKLRRSRIKEHWAALQDLPQLFIAV